ncbi:EcsC family protein [Collinsella aerofaciens]|uniref:EcsC family protein n=1 Tax=Collinsella aerofaciens TaxID=74426 RepID=UPI00189FE095|nr:EcsC family protein [Collinsella aerofaciens]MDB1858954.1 EcsC family protein [Collinsella aerofaciens]
MLDKRQQTVGAELEKWRKSGASFSSLENMMSGVLNGAGNAIKDATKEAQKKSGELAEAAGPLADSALKGFSDFANGIASTAAAAANERYNAKRQEQLGLSSTLVDDNGDWVLPDPLLSNRELGELEVLTEQYEKMVSPSKLKQLADKAGSRVPENLRATIGGAVDDLTGEIQKQALYAQVMKQVVDGFKIIEEQAAKYSVTEAQIVEVANATLEGVTIRSIDELFMLRSFDVAKIAAGENGRHLLLAATEGAATGAPGFAGLPFNIVFSMFLYYRAVQSVAMMYGFNVKEDPAELVIAGDVFSNAMAPSAGSTDGMTAAIGKVMLVAEMEGVKQTVKKGWTAMAARGGAATLIAQIRALANAAARKAIENAGKKSLENNVFKNVLEQIGRNITQKSLGKAVPVFGGVVGALFDASQMNRVLQYANIFYHKRFIIEKQERIATLVGMETTSEDSGDEICIAE